MSPPAKEKIPGRGTGDFQESANSPNTTDVTRIVRELRTILKWRREARERRVVQLRKDAQAAAPRVRARLPDNGDTARLYARLVALEEAGKVEWDGETWVNVRPRPSRNSGPRNPYTAEGLLGHFRKVRKTASGWKAVCPAHDDRNPSLAISRGRDTWLIRCWTGCTFEEITRAVRIDPQKLWFK